MGEKYLSNYTQYFLAISSSFCVFFLYFTLLTALLYYLNLIHVLPLNIILIFNFNMLVTNVIGLFISHPATN